MSITERESEYNDLEKMSVQELIQGIHNEDCKVMPAIANALPKIEILIQNILKRMKRGGRLFYLGAGTSGRLGILDASEIPPTFGVDSSCVIGIIAGGEKAIQSAVEKAEDNVCNGWKELQKYDISINDSVIGIAASGRTPFVISTIKRARSFGALTGCITNNPNSKLAEVAEFPIEAIVGPEFVTGSTRMKSGTSQKLILNMITTTLMIQLGRVKGNRMVNMQLTNEKLVERGTRMIMEELSISYDRAKSLLLKYGSVKDALDAHRSEE